MTDITNKRDLLDYINIVLGITLNTVADKVALNLTDYVNKKWYGNFSPTEYQRTYEFLKSITVLEAHVAPDGSMEAEVYFDVNKISPHIREKGLNAHASFKGKDESDKIPTWIEFGNKNILGRKDSVVEKGIHSIDYLKPVASKILLSELKKELKNNGIKIEKKTSSL